MRSSAHIVGYFKHHCNIDKCCVFRSLIATSRLLLKLLILSQPIVLKSLLGIHIGSSQFRFLLAGSEMGFAL